LATAEPDFDFSGLNFAGSGGVDDADVSGGEGEGDRPGFAWGELDPAEAL